jgi:hypothetical protein
LHPHRGQVFAGTFVAIQFAGNNHLRRKTTLGTILIFVIASLFCCRLLDCLLALKPPRIPDRLAGLLDTVESLHPDAA